MERDHALFLAAEEFQMAIKKGTRGDDTLDGTVYGDWLLGYGGKDTINGGKGDDLLTGGSEADTFVFNADHGGDKITDYTREDQIHLAPEIDGYYLFENGGNVRIVTLSGSDATGWEKEGSITLVGISKGKWENNFDLVSNEQFDNYNAPGTWTATTASTDEITFLL